MNPVFLAMEPVFLDLEVGQLGDQLLKIDRGDWLCPFNLVR
jgi:hypothetical protein